MAHIKFLDKTMRDGQQSLWGMRMQAGMALPVAAMPLTLATIEAR